MARAELSTDGLSGKVPTVTDAQTGTPARRGSDAAGLDGFTHGNVGDRPPGTR